MKMCGNCDRYGDPGKVRAMCHRAGFMVMANKAASTCPKDAYVCTTEAEASPAPVATPALAFVCDLCDPPQSFGSAQAIGAHRFRKHGLRKGDPAPVPKPVPAPVQAIVDHVNDVHVDPHADADKAGIEPLDVPCDEPCALAKESAASVAGLFADTDEGREALGQVEARVDAAVCPDAGECSEATVECTDKATTAASASFDAKWPTRLESNLTAVVNRIAILHLADQLLDARLELLKHAVKECTTWDAVTATIDEHMPGIIVAARAGAL